MQNHYAITVALSVYNVEPYLADAIDCILSQSFTDFELLCIDDASTDTTYDILKRYSLLDDRIRVIRQEVNRGLSVSRNLAISEARGEYLLMLDGDDLFAKNMLEVAYTKAKETDADMVLWDYVAFYDEKEISTKCSKLSSLLGLDSNDKIKLLQRPAFSPTRMTKVSVLRELGIHFPEGMTKQDIPVHWKLITAIDKIQLIPEYFLFYRQQPNNTSSQKGKSVMSLAYVMDITKKQLLDDGLYDVYKDEFLRSRLSLLQGMYDYIHPDYKTEALELIKERIGVDELAYINSPNSCLTPRTRLFYGWLAGKTWASIKYKVFIALRKLYRKLR